MASTNHANHLNHELKTGDYRFKLLIKFAFKIPNGFIFLRKYMIKVSGAYCIYGQGRGRGSQVSYIYPLRAKVEDWTGTITNDCRRCLLDGHC